MPPAKKPRKKQSRPKPTPLTDAVRKHILDSLKAGLPSLRQAALAAGVRENTVQEWYARGKGLDPERRPSPVHVKFADDVDQAKAFAQDRAMKMIAMKMGDSWQAAAWYLERTNPENFGLKSTHEISGPGGGPLTFDVSKLSDQDLERIIRGESVAVGRVGRKGTKTSGGAKE